VVVDQEPPAVPAPPSSLPQLKRPLFQLRVSDASLHSESPAP
jgi:hypothetical protein